MAAIAACALMLSAVAAAVMMRSNIFKHQSRFSTWDVASQWLKALTEAIRGSVSNAVCACCNEVSLLRVCKHVHRAF